ncbi:MAG: DUF423 domain-containing protein [Betaproteobacteria bacterium]|nr:DUF423 domain-containing protein [Betaproteobacteria bacterium]
MTPIPAAAKLFLALGGAAALLAVALGAFGAHGLKSRLPVDMLAVYQTGVQYHFYHALGLVLIGLAVLHLPDSAALRTAGWLMAAGILLFSGSLYALALSGERWLGAVTPIGGLAFLLGWAALVWAALRA